MKKIKLFKASTLVLFAVMACNKTSVSPTPRTENSNAKQGVEEVKQKMYDLTPEQVKSSIRILAGGADGSHSAARSFRPDTILSPDSSLWVLEAALNYHFDKVPRDHEVFVESVAFSAPLTYINGAAWVSPSDLVNVYNQFKSSIAEKSEGPKKVKVIDITATLLANGQINYTGSVVLFAGTGGFLPTCAPFDPTYLAKFSAGLYSGFGCSGPNSSAPDGPTAATTKLNNCYRFTPQCNNDYYWINVSTTLFYKAACTGPTTLPSHFLPYSATNLCTSGLLFYHSTTLTGGSACYIEPASTINSQVYACNAVAASNAPSLPGIKVSNQFVSAWYETFVNSSADWGWANIVTYGYPVCNNNPN
jgi:hypothetical protein